MTLQEQKVYCKNCKWCWFPNVDGSSIYHYCLRLGHYKDTPLDRVWMAVTCEEAESNKNNNCPYYERKWWKFWIKRSS